MRTADTTLDLTLAGTLAAAPRQTALIGVLTSVWHALRNRRAIGRLEDLDDRQLLDLGLCRDELREALDLSLFGEPGRQLMQASRNRANSYYRSARRD
ncbi:DUF1127 domain-containing protein [Pararhizobium gei]|uniref:DUF1127 domain-containing protein n=1 Tax=Pararhizobium gei TaxID=1395951 RepID=UPI0023DC8AA4|nr:DUF1127 domain-containing protein [Rhizobium gei]